MAFQPRQRNRPAIRIAMRSSMLPLVAGIALAVLAIVPPAAAKPDLDAGVASGRIDTASQPAALDPGARRLRLRY
jgi:hypothetical protein